MKRECEKCLHAMPDERRFENSVPPSMVSIWCAKHRQYCNQGCDDFWPLTQPRCDECRFGVHELNAENNEITHVICHHSSVAYTNRQSDEYDMRFFCYWFCSEWRSKE